ATLPETTAGRSPWLGPENVAVAPRTGESPRTRASAGPSSRWAAASALSSEIGRIQAAQAAAAATREPPIQAHARDEERPGTSADEVAAASGEATIAAGTAEGAAETGRREST